MTFKRSLIAILLGCGSLSALAANASCPDLALVLAIDSSGSISDEEFALQQAGYAAAFDDPRVGAALATAGVVEVAVVLWGDEAVPPQVLPWRRIAGPQDRNGLVADLATLPREVGGDTGLGAGLWAALDLLQRQDCAARRVINVSGDGRESFGARARHVVPVAMARARAEEMGVTVNGIAILTHEIDLPDWYRKQVITGPDAFVMEADSFETFPEAIIRKLVREISLPALAGVQDLKEGEP